MAKVISKAASVAQVPVTYSPNVFANDVLNAVSKSLAAKLAADKGYVGAIVGLVKSHALKAITPARYDAELSPAFTELLKGREDISSGTFLSYRSKIKALVVSLSHGFVIPQDAQTQDKAHAACVAFMTTRGFASGRGNKAGATRKAGRVVSSKVSSPGSALSAKTFAPVSTTASTPYDEVITLADMAEILFPDNPAARKAFEFFGNAPETFGNLLIKAMPAPKTLLAAVMPRRYKLAAMSNNTPF